MLEYIRNNPRVVQAMLILFILPPFLLGGASEGLRLFHSSDSDVASVDEKPVTKQEWDATMRDQIENYRRMAGARFDPKMFESPEIKSRMLDELVEKHVIDAEFKRRVLVVTDETVANAIRAIPEVAGADGKFDNAIYTAKLAQIGLTPKQHFERVRQGMMVQQVRGPIAGSAFVPRSVAERLSSINDQEREVQEILFKASDYSSKVKITEEMIKDYYAKNGKKFELPETVNIDYVVLNNAAVEAQVTITDEAAKAFYEKNLERFTEKETRRASHILVKFNRDAKPEEKAKAKAKAEKLLAQVRANKADFAKLAKENSDDPGSGSLGGDLGFFEPSGMVKPFADASFKLEKDQISDLVETEFGYHIILLTDIKPKKVKSFEEAKAEVVADVRREQVNKKFGEVAELFSNTVDEQPDGLKVVADNPKLKLKVETATDLTSKSNPGLAPDLPTNNQKLLTALFANQEILKGKRNTDVIDLGQNTLVAAHVTKHNPAKVRPLEEVKPAIEAFLMQIEVQKMAKKDGEAKLTALKAKDDVAGFGEVKVMSRVKPASVSPVAMTEIMKADTSKLPAFAGVEIPGQGYAIYRISKVSQPATLDTARRASELDQFNNIVAQNDMYAAMELMKKNNKVKINKVAANIGTASASASSAASTQ